MRPCPHCHQPLHLVQTTSHYGAHVHLDQCPRCGGLWFDGTELFEVEHGQVEELEKIDLVKLAAETALSSGALHCPVDGRTMTKFADPHFPSTIDIEVCPHCRGVWLNHGEFRQFQSDLQAHRERKKSERLDSDSEAQLESLFAKSASPRYDTLGRLGKLLSTRVDPRTYQPLPGNDMDTQHANQVRVVSSIANAILAALLRRFTRT